jgi:hypothetical protein
VRFQSHGAQAQLTQNAQIAGARDVIARNLAEISLTRPGAFST